MTKETIVAAFDSIERASMAARDVEAAGVPQSRITQHGGTAEGATTADATRKEPGFWAKLFGTEADGYDRDTSTLHDHTVYDRTMSGGGSVLSIAIDDAEADGSRILDVLDRHNPVDVEERAASYAGATANAGYGDATTGTASAATGYAATPATGDQTIQLAEEQLVVGKRVMNRGTTRIRRYVVETPVSEDVSLRRESVSVDRRPVSGTANVAADAFTDRTIEVTEQNEEAVVGKTAHVVEEVVVRKNVEDRVETVKDTVRREELEVEKVDETDPVTTKAY